MEHVGRIEDSYNATNVLHYGICGKEDVGKQKDLVNK
jgi:hypothetical protein